MNRQPITVSSSKNPALTIQVTPGHFATSSSHVSHYLNMSDLKTNVMMAKEIAREIAVPYLANDIVDTIICMENTEVIGAYLADELLQEGTMVMNTGEEINVITPAHNTNGQLLFPPSENKHIFGKNIILLVASVSSGKTIHRAMEGLAYYGGELLGISALFSAVPSVFENEINAVFSDADIPGYRFADLAHCEMCKEGHRLEAIVNSLGFVKL